ncbi:MULTISPECIES: SARP family transcriptional regulator [unclassified Labrenzia]|uniref:SARP family transcriptional regulator n=1 Tax=Stappiaceae TaxID=2821832 RepID=UPI0012683AD1|nr:MULTISPECIES: SARP family transcriptional regulator [unclassified Labrenzia]MBO9459105.1 SARP family transcriptional regulator [Labrenzia sp. R5_0]
MLAVLLLVPGNELARQKAAALLWEDVAQTRAMANLRQLLVRVQSKQPEAGPLIETTQTRISLGPGAQSSDLAAFLQSCKATDLEGMMAGIEQFTGELLDGMEFEGEQLNLWLLTERASLREKLFNRAAAALEETTRFGADRGGNIGKIADRLLAFEPDSPECYRIISKAYGRCGDQDGVDRIDRLMNSVLNPALPRVPGNTSSKPSGTVWVAPTGVKPVEERPAPPKPPVPRVAFSSPRHIDQHPDAQLAEAFVEDVANSFSRFKTFVVVSPFSTMRDFRGGNVSNWEKIRSNYSVQSFLLPGSQKISFTVIDDGTGEIIWSAEYSMEPEDLHYTFRLLAKTVAANLAQQIERQMLDSGRSINAQSYLHVLRGQNLIKTCNLSMIRRARKEFRQGLTYDKDLSIARARIAQTMQLEWLLLGGTDPHLLHRAKAEADAAIEIDSTAGIGYWMAAVIALYQRDYATSEAKFQEAETLSPNSSDLLIQHADALAHFGKPKDAWNRFKHAIDLNPLAPDIYWWAGASIAFKLADYAEAVRLCKQMDDEEPALRILTASLALDGQIESARQYARRLMDVYPGMTAQEISRFMPDKNPENSKIFLEGLKLAGFD